MKADDIEKVREGLRNKAMCFRSTFGTPDGKMCLEHLKEQFEFAELVGTDPHQTYRNVGRREVVRYIEEIIQYSEKQDGR